jgi:hypothetical protein
VFPHKSMHQNPSWEAKSCSASQEIPSTLCNPKICYSAHKSTSSAPVMNQKCPYNPISSKSNLIYPLLHPNGLILYTLLSTTIHATCFTSLIIVLIILMLSGEFSESGLQTPYNSWSKFHFLLVRFFWKICPNLKLCVIFCNTSNFYGKGLSVIVEPQTEELSLVSYLQLHSQREDRPVEQMCFRNKVETQ